MLSANLLHRLQPSRVSLRPKPLRRAYGFRLFLCGVLLTIQGVGFHLSIAQESKPPSTVSLFDGESLKDWEFDADHWHVENNAIVGQIPKGQRLNKNTWMIWRGGKLNDFDLQLQFKLTGAPTANSGIQIRCQATKPRSRFRLPS